MKTLQKATARIKVTPDLQKKLKVKAAKMEMPIGELVGHLYQVIFAPKKVA